MKIYLKWQKQPALFQKNGICYRFWGNTTLEQNEIKLFHEYRLNPKDLRHKRW